MHGIVSLLDEDHYRMVEDVWAGLEEALGVRGIFTTPFPHFSYHVADHYDVALLEPLLHPLETFVPREVAKGEHGQSRRRFREHERGGPGEP